MANYKQSTAYTRTFIMVQTADHISGLTGATVAVKISKAGAAGAAAGGTVTEVDATNNPGLYKIVLTTTDTNTLGDLSFHCTATSGDPTDFIDQITANILGDTLPANATQINGVATTSVTTINANQGTTQPLNFTGTGASALVKSDMIDIASAAVATGTAQIGVNVVSYASGQAPLQPTVAGRTLDISVAGNAGLDWANIDAPTTAQGLTGTTISATQVVASVSGAVASVTGNVGGNVTGSIGSLGTTAKTDVSTAVLTTQMTESYASLHTVPTLAQVTFEMRALLAENSVGTTTVTTKKLDGATSAHTYTINSATAPTSITTAS